MSVCVCVSECVCWSECDTSKMVGRYSTEFHGKEKKKGGRENSMFAG